MFAGQYVDGESGWAYNRFRFYSPALGVYGAPDPLGGGPNIGSAQGYVTHPGCFIDQLGLEVHKVGKEELRLAGVKESDLADVQEWLKSRPTDSMVYIYPSRETGKMQYIGMSADPQLRAVSHGDRFGTAMDVATIDQGALSPGADAFTRRQSRAFEQYGIETYGLDELQNRRNEIGVSSKQPSHIKDGATKWAGYMVQTGAVKIVGL